MSYASTVLADSPLLYWRMADPSGTTCTDSSGNSRNGTYVGSPTLGATGLIADANPAVTFNGSSQRVTLTYAAWMDVGTITLEAVVKYTSTGAIQSILDRDSTGTAPRVFQFRINASGKFEAVLWDSTAALWVTTGTTTLTSGSTYHLAVTYDGTTVTLYVNGVSDGTSTHSGTLQTGTRGFAVAANASGFQWFNGTIDEVAVYSGALSSTRIAAHATAAFTPNVVAQANRRPRFPFLRRGRSISRVPAPVVTAQALPPQPGRAGRHSAPPLPKRRTSRSIPPNQAVTTAPLSPQGEQRRRFIPLPRRRASRSVVPAGTTAPTTQSLPPQGERRLLRLVTPRRQRGAQNVPTAAQTVTTQALPPQGARRLLRLVVPRRERGAQVIQGATPGAVVTPPVVVARGRHAAPPVPRRQRGAQAAPTTIPNPPAVARGWHQAPPVPRRRRGAQLLPIPVTTQPLPPQPATRRRVQIVRKRVGTVTFPWPTITSPVTTEPGLGTATVITLADATITSAPAPDVTTTGTASVETTGSVRVTGPGSRIRRL